MCPATGLSSNIPTRAATWSSRPSKGLRWDDSKMRELSSTLEACLPPSATTSTRPVPRVNRTRKFNGPRGHQPSAPAPVAVAPFPTSSIAIPERKEPSKPINFRLEGYQRERKVEKKVVLLSNPYTEEEREQLCRRLKVQSCAVRGCNFPSVTTSCYCDVHSCTKICEDGYRCPNMAVKRDEDRQCATGLHEVEDQKTKVMIENPKLTALKELRKRYTAQENFMKEDEYKAHQLYMMENFPHLTIDRDHPYGPIYPNIRITPPTQPNTAETSPIMTASTSSPSIKTPPTPKVILPEVDAWWKGDWKALDWKTVESGKIAPAGLGLKVSVEEVDEANDNCESSRKGSSIKGKGKATEVVYNDDGALEARIKKNRNLRNGIYRSVSADGRRMAKLMSERFNTGYVRKRTFGNIQPGSE